MIEMNLEDFSKFLIHLNGSAYAFCCWSSI